MWTALFGNRRFVVLNGVVGVGHMFGLLMRRIAAGHDEVRRPGSRSLRRAVGS
jgi:hypothetical protein